MKCPHVILALVSLSVFAPNLHASPITTFTVDGVSHSTVVTPILGGEVFTYLDIDTDVLQTTLQAFTATFTDILGVKLLNVTNVCASLNILAPPDPCSALAFTFTDVSLGDAFLISSLGTVGVNLTGNAAGVNFGASIGGGTTEIGFHNPPAVPEPGTFGLVATGLLGAAGALRKRLTA